MLKKVYVNYVGNETDKKVLMLNMARVYHFMSGYLLDINTTVPQDRNYNRDDIRRYMTEYQRKNLSRNVSDLMGHRLKFGAYKRLCQALYHMAVRINRDENHRIMVQTSRKSRA